MIYGYLQWGGNLRLHEKESQQRKPLEKTRMRQTSTRITQVRKWPWQCQMGTQVEELRSVVFENSPIINLNFLCVQCLLSQSLQFCEMLQHYLSYAMGNSESSLYVWLECTDKVESSHPSLCRAPKAAGQQQKQLEGTEQHMIPGSQ